MEVDLHSEHLKTWLQTRHDPVATATLESGGSRQRRTFTWSPSLMEVVTVLSNPREQGLWSNCKFSMRNQS
ncbi:hypothetical protein AOLI_G00060780 [Acnodon oligacanthus]